jgi:hypothetical protein
MLRRIVGGIVQGADEIVQQHKRKRHTDNEETPYKGPHQGRHISEVVADDIAARLGYAEEMYLGRLPSEVYHR